MTRACPTPNATNADSMWRLLSDLFPRYRALCGPDYRASLDIIARRLPLNRTDIRSGTSVNGWRVPKEFVVKEAWVASLDGKRVLDFAVHPFHLKIYSQPYSGVVDRETLLQKVATSEELPTAIPLRQCYYVNDWGFCATKQQRDALQDGEYRVHIDVEHGDGTLTVGECYLEGRSKSEIVFTSYLCHPRGANDNLSGVVVAVELMRLLSSLPERRYSYRLLLNPETIGSLAWIHSDLTRLDHIVGGYEISICGDRSPVRYFSSMVDDAAVDRAGIYALAACGSSEAPVRHSFLHSGCDQRQFNAPGIRKPFGRWGRAGPSNYPEYHTSADDLSVVTPETLLGTLAVIWQAISALERSFIYRPTYVGLPFLSGLGVYPYRHYKGDGEPQLGNIAKAYYELLGWVDGQRDMIDIAQQAGLPIEAFDEAVADFLRVGLIEPVED